jgi:hypothetical protein
VGITRFYTTQTNEVLHNSDQIVSPRGQGLVDSA